MGNPWTEHVKEWAKKKGVSYMCAMSTPECRTSYTPQKQLKKQMKEAKRAEKEKPKAKKEKTVKGKGTAFFTKKIKQKINQVFIPAMSAIIKRTQSEFKKGADGKPMAKIMEGVYKEILAKKGLEPYFANYQDNFDYLATIKKYNEGYYKVKKINGKEVSHVNEWKDDLWTDNVENLFNEYYERSGELEGIKEAFGGDEDEVMDTANALWDEIFDKKKMFM